MTVFHSILLGLIQGITEFLPVSSTAHLTLAENLLLKRSMPLGFDVLLHVGTLLALVIYFRHPLIQMVMGLFGWDSEGRKLAGWLLVAMVPTVLFALLTKHVKEVAKDHIWIYGVCLVLTAGLLFLANETSRRKTGREVRDIHVLDALMVGSIQGIGGGFGLSRSGSTISVGVLRGMKLPASTQFSFLLGIPTILGAAVLESWHIVKPLLHHQPLPSDVIFPEGPISPAFACVLGIGAAAIAGYLSIGLLDLFTRKPRLNGFAVYCVLIGAVLIVMGIRA